MKLVLAAAVGAAAVALQIAAQPIAVDDLLAEGEALLAAGDAAGAEASFERAAALAHSPQLESSLVRAYMQSGQYRRALTFAAHAAGAHREYPGAAALYAWLLHIGGQRAVAARVLEDVPAVVANDEVLRMVRLRLATASPCADGALLEPPVRLAPYATATPAPAAVVASAVLIDEGRRALTTGLPVTAAASVWLRNGRGETVPAELERYLQAGESSLAVLRLASPLPQPDDVTASARAAFAGSVVYAVEFARAPAHAEPAWPLLSVGFLGRPPAAGEPPLLGIDLPAGERGGPVFDDAGRIVGIAAVAADGRDRLISTAAIPQGAGLFGPESFAGPTPRMSLDLLYERSLLLTLQVIVPGSASRE